MSENGSKAFIGALSTLVATVLGSIVINTVSITFLRYLIALFVGSITIINIFYFNRHSVGEQPSKGERILASLFSVIALIIIILVVIDTETKNAFDDPQTGIVTELPSSPILTAVPSPTPIPPSHQPLEMSVLSIKWNSNIELPENTVVM